MKRYDPQPIDTSGSEIPPELGELVERLAENSHDVWALQRMRDGWSYGAARDDDRKLHPDLVPYEDLPESEKEYDRVTVSATLRAIAALGYRVCKKG